ncbi:hypothetical protein CFIMG_002636RA [Ceratocystis fimbriata CBS 114723]|uniref:Uncharacterized protein n=1 Tax=Ceratocystis fimbriata CBS 114723 TaxID=1035309 RepID=A0A2C5XJE1_9PEZI|nr:hypothetical protein CFIMG_002636RA [Ceratocystis fimbriata CBS 114723]
MVIRLNAVQAQAKPIGQARQAMFVCFFWAVCRAYLLLNIHRFPSCAIVRPPYSKLPSPFESTSMRVDTSTAFSPVQRLAA